ncbi:hypothetical protein ACFPRL_32110 [Pseudoclavibacter helvolus]
MVVHRWRRAGPRHGLHAVVVGRTHCADIRGHGRRRVRVRGAEPAPPRAARIVEAHTGRHHRPRRLPPRAALASDPRLLVPAPIPRAVTYGQPRSVGHRDPRRRRLHRTPRVRKAARRHLHRTVPPEA